MPSAPLVHGRAYCCVFYGKNPEYLLLLLVLVWRLQKLGTLYPFLVLPTPDIPQRWLAVLELAGCIVLPRVRYLKMHRKLLRDPKGRHARVLTKLWALGFPQAHEMQLEKVLLVDADLLPRSSIDFLFDLSPPAAMLMPIDRWWDCVMDPLTAIPPERLWVSYRGMLSHRVNAGICLLRPDRALFDQICNEVSPRRQLRYDTASDTVVNVFGHSWRPSWTPEEDALTRALLQRSGSQWTHLGAKHNFEVVGDWDYDLGNESEHRGLTLDEVVIYHFVGAWKPSWWAYFTHRSKSHDIDEIVDYLKTDLEHDPRGIMATATGEWLRAFTELEEEARENWKLDVLELIGW